MAPANSPSVRGDDLAQRLVPDELWELVAPLLPDFGRRQQGGGTAPVADRVVFTAVVFVLTSGCTWRDMPATFGVSPATAHRRFVLWTGRGLWPSLHRAVLDRPDLRDSSRWSTAIVQAARRRGSAQTSETRPPDRRPDR